MMSDLDILLEQIRNRSPVIRAITYKHPEIICRVMVKRTSKTSAWYASRVGEIFLVASESEESYFLLPDGQSMRWINKEDCRKLGKFELYVRRILKRWIRR